MKTLILDMYGVIIKESKGNFIPYTFNSFGESEHERLTKLFKVDRLFGKAGNGEINSFEFLTALGFDDPEFHMKDYIENHLTMDEDFYPFADRFTEKYNFVLLSNDVSDWSKYITKYYNLDKYLTAKVVSADVHCRKPDPKIFETALHDFNVSAEDCIFVDNSVENLKAADKFGIDTVLFNRDNENYDGKTVYSFGELADIL